MRGFKSLNGVNLIVKKSRGCRAVCGDAAEAEGNALKSPT